LLKLGSVFGSTIFVSLHILHGWSFLFHLCALCQMLPPCQRMNLLLKNIEQDFFWYSFKW
jgi:hypothetical protein